MHVLGNFDGEKYDDDCYDDDDNDVDDDNVETNGDDLLTDGSRRGTNGPG